MNKQILEGRWDQLKGRIKQQWAALTEDDLTAIEGKRDVLEGKIKERYGYDRERIKHEVDKFFEQKENSSCCN